MDAAPAARSGDLRPEQYCFNCRTGGWREDPADEEGRQLHRPLPGDSLKHFIIL
jgi:hypothetical protein